ncbi:hypothetical protein LB505_006970 [Fusarium chuoi]|nr:hypothetical protein LB505_006970 [Fusarium chuoi]
MWAQRRGALAVIVGDNQKGGPLIQMFAHGPEVDNVTIPSVFTARTTAQLLSALTQPGSFIEDTLDNQGNPVLRVQRGSTVNKASSPRLPPRPTIDDLPTTPTAKLKSTLPNQTIKSERLRLDIPEKLSPRKTRLSEGHPKKFEVPSYLRITTTTGGILDPEGLNL